MHALYDILSCQLGLTCSYSSILCFQFIFYSQSPVSDERRHTECLQ